MSQGKKNRHTLQNTPHALQSSTPRGILSDTAENVGKYPAVYVPSFLWKKWLQNTTVKKVQHEKTAVFRASMMSLAIVLN